MNKQFERIRLRILATLAIISISLCVITVILWPISYAAGVQVSVRNGAGVRYALVTTPGELGLIVVSGEPRSVTMNLASKSFGSGSTSATDPIRWYWNDPETKLGFGRSEGSATINYDEIKNTMTAAHAGQYVPIWLVALLTFIGPTWWYLARRRREFRLENGLCMYCGTDMTASPYRCPACGKEPPW